MTDKKKLNYLMNKISMALKDATLQQGFEIICKKIAKLEKENAELKKTNTLLYEQEKEKIKLIEKMKCCQNCKYCGACNRACNNWDKWEIYD